MGMFSPDEKPNWSDVSFYEKQRRENIERSKLLQLIKRKLLEISDNGYLIGNADVIVNECVKEIEKMEG